MEGRGTGARGIDWRQEVRRGWRELVLVGLIWLAAVRVWVALFGAAGLGVGQLCCGIACGFAVSWVAERILLPVYGPLAREWGACAMVVALYLYIAWAFAT